MFHQIWHTWTDGSDGFHMHGSKQAEGRKTKGEISVDRTDCRVVHSCNTAALSLNHPVTTRFILFCMPQIKPTNWDVKIISTSPSWNEISLWNVIFYSSYITLLNVTARILCSVWNVRWWHYLLCKIWHRCRSGIGSDSCYPASSNVSSAVK